MTSYTDKHLARARDLARWSIAGLTFSNEEALELHVAFVAPKIAEALADAEREAFRRAAEIAEKHFDLRHNATARACGMSVAAAIRSEMEGR